MYSEDAWAVIEETVLDRPSPARMFNPYRDIHHKADREDATAIRRQNLKSYLKAYAGSPQVFMLAEAPGPWGCRFSGVPITSEAQLLDAEFPLAGEPSSQMEAPHTEYSASIFWRVMAPYFPHFFVWNAVPFHPHDEGEPFSIRNPGRREVRLFQSTLGRLLQLAEPEMVIAIGRKAERSLNEIDQPCTYVRHPSQGGATKFEEGVTELFADLGIAAQ